MLQCLCDKTLQGIDTVRAWANNNSFNWVSEVAKVNPAEQFRNSGLVHNLHHSGDVTRGRLKEMADFSSITLIAALMALS